MNRQQRRHPEKHWDEEFAQVTGYRNELMRDCMPEEYFRKKVAAMDKLQRNGITVEHLKENYDKGWQDGFKEAAEPVIRGCFAAICLALNDLHGFGQKRCMAVLNAVDEHLTYTLSSIEAIDEVYKRMGLQIEFKEPFDRVREAEKQ